MAKAEKGGFITYFSPVLLEALVRYLRDEGNGIRLRLGMPLLDEQDIIDQLNNHIVDIEPKNPEESGLW